MPEFSGQPHSTAYGPDSLTLEAPVARGLMQSPLPAVIFDAKLQIAWANEAAGKVSCGRPAAQWRGRRLAEVLPGMDAGLIERSLRSVLETGRPVTDLEVRSQALDEPGGQQFWSCVQFPVKEPEGDCAGWVASNDTTVQPVSAPVRAISFTGKSKSEDTK